MIERAIPILPGDNLAVAGALEGALGIT